MFFKTKNRLFFLNIVCLLLLTMQIVIFSLTARCQSQEKQEKIEVINLLVSGGTSGRALRGGVEKFNEQFKGKYLVQMDEIGYEALYEKAVSQFISGSSIYDVFGLMDLWIPSLTQYLEPLNIKLGYSIEDLLTLYGQSAIEGASFEGNVYALPARNGFYILFYRQDWLDEYGLEVPQTLEELLKAAEVLSKIEGVDFSEKIYGMALQFQSESWTPKVFAAIFQSYGGRILNEDFTSVDISLKGPACLETLDFIKNLNDKGIIPPPMSWTYDDNILSFQTGKLAFAIDYSSRALTIEKTGEAIGKMGYAPSPHKEVGPYPPATYSSIWYLGVDKNSTVKDGAIKLVEFLCSKEIQRYMAIEWANGPTVLEIYDEPEYAATNPASKAIKETLMLGSATYPCVQVAELEMVIHEEIHKMLTGQSVEETAEAIYNRLEKIMKN